MKSGKTADLAQPVVIARPTQAERAGPNQDIRAAGVSDRCPQGAKPQRGFDAQHESTTGQWPGTQSN